RDGRIKRYGVVLVIDQVGRIQLERWGREHQARVKQEDSQLLVGPRRDDQRFGEESPAVSEAESALWVDRACPVPLEPRVAGILERLGEPVEEVLEGHHPAAAA